MIPATLYKNKSVVVFGLGKSGFAAIESMVAGGATVYAADDKDTAIAKAGSLGAITLPLNEIPWPDITSLILSPGVPLTHPEPHAVVKLAKEHKVEIIGDIELLYRHCPNATYIGITGTNGKSTTTALTYHILKSAGMNVQVGGNLGMPVLGLEPASMGAFYVLELSSYQLDLVNSLRVNIAMLINITPDHIDRHGTMLGYINAKMNIFARQTNQDKAIVGIDDQFVAGIFEFLDKIEHKKVIPVTTKSQIADGYFSVESSVFETLNTARIKEYDIHTVSALRGEHNLQNACFAVAAATACGVSYDKIFHALLTFPGLAHRMERVAVFEGLEFINDSKATNADAAAKALGSFSNIFWIAGGKAKEGGIEALEKYFPKIIKAYLIGAAENEFANTLEGKTPYEKCGNLQRAFEKAAEDAMFSGMKNAVVLLSPACASFDQWPNFEARGDAFREMSVAFVSKYAAASTSVMG